MDKNPYKPGSDEYLDWVTAQHDKATAPKKVENTSVKKATVNKPPARKQSTTAQALAAYEQEVSLAKPPSPEEQKKSDFRRGIKKLTGL